MGNDQSTDPGEVEEDELRSLEMEEISEILDEDRFPATTEEIIEEYGDREVDYPTGSERLENILEASGEETYETPDEAQLAVLNGVSREAVGRPRYSDRSDATSEHDDWTRDQESL